MHFEYLTKKRKMTKEDRRFDTTWDSTGFLMMCIADMEIKTPQPMLDDLTAKVQEGNFVYTYLNKKMNAAIRVWYQKRFQFDLKCDNIVYGNGVMHLIQTAIAAFTNPGDGIIIQAPVYGPFYDVINSKKRTIIDNTLVYDSQTHHYTIDFELLATQMAPPNVKMMVLCSPHNPVGRVWTESELTKLVKLAVQHHVLVVSDEIWHDIIFEGYEHHPLIALNQQARQHTIVIASLAKTYNLGSMQYGYAIVPNKQLYQKLETELKASIDYMSHNVISAEAVKSGYTNPGCYQWYVNLKIQIEKNFKYIKDHLSAKTNIIVTKSEGTYLVWLDMSAVTKNGAELHQRLFKAKIHCNEGQKMYGSKYWNFLRVNIADQPKNIHELVVRLVREFQ